MNQLMAKSAGFGIGSQVTPETMGIWVWGRPLKIEHPNGPSQWVLLLDTEGFAATNVSENYDAKIFAVATLLSGQLLYNSVKIIDQSDIDYLELLARRTQLFALKAQMSSSSSDNGNQNEETTTTNNDKDTTVENWTEDFSPQLLNFPSLIWVIQDFVQETGGEHCRDWLLRLLTDTHAREADSYSISLKDIFPSVDCHTLFIPASRKAHLADLSRATEADLTPEYRLERDALVEKVKRRVAPKRRNDGKAYTGVELAALLRVLVTAANAGSLTEIPNRWDAFLEQLQKSAVEDCYKFYQAHLNGLFESASGGGGGGSGGNRGQANSAEHNAQTKSFVDAVSERRLSAWSAVSKEKALSLLGHLLQGLPEPLERSRPELTDLIERYYAAAADLNRQKIHLRLFNVQKALELKVIDELALVRLPVLSAQLVEKADNLTEVTIGEFTTAIGDLVEPANLTSYTDGLRRSVRLNLDSTLLRNGQALEVFFENITSTLLNSEAFNEVPGLKNVAAENSAFPPPPRKAFEASLEASISRSVAAFTRRVDRFAEERALFEGKLAKLKVALQERAEALRAANRQAVSAYLAGEAATVLADFDRRTATTARQHFPLDTEELRTLLEAEARAARTVFSEDYAPKYADYGEVYEAAVSELDRGLELIGARRQEENFRAFKAEVETPLQLAKRSILLSGDKYATLFSFKRFVISSCMLHLDDGKAKHWPERLKLQIVQSFMREDEQLRSEVESRTGLWSRLLGFFQWLASLVGFA
ncbi:PREDICTED: uncharacterized protein LOC108380673 [Rhagoletis zephyria]|uniref:uncharacterized protein LOC108380673 n=1 Tax=Rhagoletis zephyria TaxID=28612 RepID=UPI000811759C|nr:PREDICTED: uncharacterized protein LOC108380673 [Rhagoletis zephyria]